MALTPEIAVLSKDMNDMLVRISKTQIDLNEMVNELKAQIIVLKSASQLSAEDKAEIQALDTAARGIDVPAVPPPPVEPGPPPVVPPDVP